MKLTTKTKSSGLTYTAQSLHGALRVIERMKPKTNYLRIIEQQNAALGYSHTDMLGTRDIIRRVAVKDSKGQWAIDQPKLSEIYKSVLKTKYTPELTFKGRTIPKGRLAKSRVSRTTRGKSVQLPVSIG